MPCRNVWFDAKTDTALIGLVPSLGAAVRVFLERSVGNFLNFLNFLNFRNATRQHVTVIQGTVSELGCMLPANAHAGPLDTIARAAVGVAAAVSRPGP